MRRKLKKLYFALLKVKVMIPIRAVVRIIARNRFESQFKKRIEEIRKKYDICVFILATPIHGNLGDHAIVHAELKILEKCGYRENVVEISNRDYLRCKDIIKKYVIEDDIIIVDGGGNLGTLWPLEDDKISEIINTYRNNKIIVFPQTCYYDGSDQAKLRLNKNKQIYSKASKLVILLRDRVSYEFCCANFENVQFKYVPDIVLSLCEGDLHQKRENSLFCFRGDLEKTISDADREKLHFYLREKGIKCGIISTIHSGNISKRERCYRLKELWKLISGSKLLLTDRLHGMIFAAITGTPCLALDNKSKKVSGVYEWISELNYIHVCKDVGEMIDLIPEFYEKGEQTYPTFMLSDAFRKIEELLK